MIGRLSLQLFIKVHCHLLQINLYIMLVWNDFPIQKYIFGEKLLNSHYTLSLCLVAGHSHRRLR